MMQIYLLRHGIAEDAKPGESDANRALTNEGRDKLRRVLKRARAADVTPTLILASPLRRAIETAEVAKNVLAYEGEIVKSRALIPEASPHEVWDEIRARKQEKAILLASHEPLMSSLLAFLLNCEGLLVDYKKGSLTRVDSDRFGPQPHCVLRWMLTPGLAVDL
jgi:phosphohistidine phosphatase